jgi:hypothetical protein
MIDRIVHHADVHAPRELDPGPSQIKGKDMMIDRYADLLHVEH